jgi:hypothetical protein
LKEIQREFLSVVEQNIPIDIQKQRMKRWSECHAVVIRCTLLPDDLLDCLPMMCSQKKRLVSKRPLRQIVVLDRPKMKVQIKCHREDLSQKLCLQEKASDGADSEDRVVPIGIDDLLEEHMKSPHLWDESHSIEIFNPKDHEKSVAIIDHCIHKQFDTEDSFLQYDVQRRASSITWTAEMVYKTFGCILSSDQKRDLIQLLQKDISQENLPTENDGGDELSHGNDSDTSILHQVIADREQDIHQEKDTEEEAPTCLEQFIDTSRPSIEIINNQSSIQEVMELSKESESNDVDERTTESVIQNTDRLEETVHEYEDDAPYTREDIQNIKAEVRDLLLDYSAQLEKQLQTPLQMHSKVSMNDIAHMMPFISEAANARALGLSKIYNPSLKYEEAHPLQARSLSCCLQTHPIGHANWIMDPISVYSQVGKILNNSVDTDSNITTFPTPQLSSVEFSNDCLQGLLLSFVCRPQFLNSYYKMDPDHRLLPENSDISRLVEHIERIESTGIKPTQIFTTQYDIQEELASFSTFREFIRKYSEVHQSSFYHSVIELAQKQVAGQTILDRKLVLENWMKLVLECIPGGSSRKNQLLFHVYKAMTSVESLYGLVFGDETLDSLPIGYGAKECWDNIDLEELMNFKTKEKNIVHLPRVIDYIITYVLPHLQHLGETDVEEHNQSPDQEEDPPNNQTRFEQQDKDPIDTIPAKNLDSSNTRFLEESYWKSLHTEISNLDLQTGNDNSYEDLFQRIKRDVLNVIQLESSNTTHAKKEIPVFWDQIMTETQSYIVMEHYRSLDDWELTCMLLRKDDNGDLIDVVTEQPMGVRLIDVTFCEGFRNLKLLSDASLISVYPVLDKPWTHPLKNQNSALDMDTDLKLHSSVKNAHTVYKDNVGYSMNWNEIKIWPPDIFLVPFEKLKKTDPNYEEIETSPRSKRKTRPKPSTKSKRTKSNPGLHRPQPSTTTRKRRRLPIRRREEEEEDVNLQDNTSDDELILSDGDSNQSEDWEQDIESTSDISTRTRDTRHYQLRQNRQRPKKYIL